MTGLVAYQGGGPTQFGFTTAFGMPQMVDADRQVATQTWLPARTYNSITAYVSAGAGADVCYAIYSDSAGEPGTLIAQTAVASPTGGAGWFTISLPPTTLTAGTYWLALAAGGSPTSYRYDGSGGQWREQTNPLIPTQTGFLPTWGSGNASAGMVSIYASTEAGGGGNWSLLGATKNTNEADLQAKLITIDPDVNSPTRGIGTQIMDLGIMMMAGLAIDANGTLYGVDRGLNNPGEVPPGTESDLYIIDPFPAPGTLTHIGALPWNIVEALEFAFGDYDPTITAIPGVPGPWRTNGVLFGFSDAFDMLMVIDPSSGSAVPAPGSFITVDCEGLVFVTYLSDPLYTALRGYD